MTNSAVIWTEAPGLEPRWTHPEVCDDPHHRRRQLEFSVGGLPNWFPPFMLSEDVFGKRKVALASSLC